MPASSAPYAASIEGQLEAEFIACRERTCSLGRHLPVEDMNLQTAAFASPGKWHFAHTSWFFETFILQQFLPDYGTFNPAYTVLFNSYYNGIGPQHDRDKRGQLSRPTLEEVLDYRAHVDEMMRLLFSEHGLCSPELANLVKLGIEHEKQHQELFITDLKYNLYQNPLMPSAHIGNFNEPSVSGQTVSEAGSESHDGPVQLTAGVYQIGAAEAASPQAFCFDNELPAHRILLSDCRVDSRLVTNGEFLEFILAGGYRKPEFWLADGWQAVKDGQWQAPLYWSHDFDQPKVYSLIEGTVDLDLDAPVSHISGYEAEAYASFKQARLPTEQEWEIAVTQSLSDRRKDNLQWFGQCWQWTSSAYRPYPGFVAQSGAVGEYNGKFMANQWVLRGGSVATSSQHTRSSYRNFFYPEERWQFSGLRLARDST